MFDATTDIVGRIYEAAYDQSLWPAVVEDMRGLFHGSNACLARIGPDVQSSDAIAANTDPAYTQLYIEEFAQETGVYEAAVAAAPVGLVYHEHDLFGAQALRESRFWNEWMAPQDMYGGLTCKVLASGASSWIFDVQRGRGQETFDAADRGLFEFLAPHVRRAVQLGRNLQTSQMLASTFSHLPFGIALVDGTGRIVAMNEAAETLIAAPTSALTGKCGRLSISDARFAATLARLIADACLVRGGVAPGLGGDFLLTSRAEGERPTVSISVGPLVRSRTMDIPLEPCAVVMMRELSVELRSGFAGHMRALFNLTAREAALAEALAGGVSLKNAADEMGIRFSTARSYLEEVFRKTGTNRQTQLVALLWSAQPILRR